LGLVKILIIVVLLIIVILLVVGVIDGNRFVVVNNTFEMPKLKKSCRFVLISDLHNKVYGNNNDKVIEAVDRAKPDFILLAGDLVTSKVEEDMLPGIELVNELSKRYKIYYGLGNHESKMKSLGEKFNNKYEKLRRAIDNKNVFVLENASQYIPEYNINVTGLELDLKYYAHFRIRKMKEGYLENLLPACDTSKCNILIAHNPSYFNEYAAWGADMVVSGHVHGGIMRLPILGGVIAPSYMLFPKYDGGVFRSGASTEGVSTMLLSRGMGSHTFKLRFFNPAELHVIDLNTCTLDEK
jgi:hypothetical protein